MTFLAALLLLLSPPAAPHPVDAQPVAALRSVCLQDRVALSAKEYRDISYEPLPVGARVAFNRAVPGLIPHRMRQILEPLPSAAVPNRILARRLGGDFFLILPAPQRSGVAAQTCAVLWRGRLSDAGEFMNEIFRMSAVTAAGVPQRLELLRTIRDGVEYTAAEYSGWAVIAVTPETPAAGEKG